MLMNLSKTEETFEVISIILIDSFITLPISIYFQKKFSLLKILEIPDITLQVLLIPVKDQFLLRF